MAKYGIETEVTTHLKGMTFGESSDNQSSTGGGGNSFIVNDTNSRVGDYNFSTDSSIRIIESEYPFMLNGAKEFSFIEPILSLIEPLYLRGVDISTYAEQLGYNGLSSDFYEQYLDSMSRGLYVSLFDVVSVTNFREWDNPVSTAILPYYVVLAKIGLDGDSRPYDEILDEVLESMESHIYWDPQLSGTKFQFIIPRVNKDGLIRLIKDAVIASAQSGHPTAIIHH